MRTSLICLRLVSVASAAALFVVTTSVEEFEYGLRRLGFPWKLAFLFSLTLKLLPEMKRKYRKIEEAQKGGEFHAVENRGLKLRGNCRS